MPVLNQTTIIFNTQIIKTNWNVVLQLFKTGGITHFFSWLAIGKIKGNPQINLNILTTTTNSISTIIF